MFAMFQKTASSTAERDNENRSDGGELSEFAAIDESSYDVVDLSTWEFVDDDSGDEQQDRYSLDDAFEDRDDVIPLNRDVANSVIKHQTGCNDESAAVKGVGDAINGRDVVMSCGADVITHEALTEVALEGLSHDDHSSVYDVGDGDEEKEEEYDEYDDMVQMKMKDKFGSKRRLRKNAGGAKTASSYRMPYYQNPSGVVYAKNGIRSRNGGPTYDFPRKGKVYKMA